MENLQQLPLLPGHNYYLHVPMDNGTDGNTFEVGLANITWGHQLSARTNEMSSHAARKLWSVGTNQRLEGFTVYFNFLILRRAVPTQCSCCKGTKRLHKTYNIMCALHIAPILLSSLLYILIIFYRMMPNAQKVSLNRWGFLSEDFGFPCMHSHQQQQSILFLSQA